MSSVNDGEKQYGSGRPKKGSQRNYIKQWRIARGLNQPQLGAKAGLTGSQISQLEVGRARYSQKSLEAIAEALGCEPWHLLGVDPSEDAWAPFITVMAGEDEDGQKIRAPGTAEAYIKMILDRFARSGKK
jgi:transcriptional regulator with XRE-family HTH domain